MFSCTKGIWTQLATAQCDEGSEGKCDMFASFVYQAPMNNLRLIRCVDINCMARGLSCVSESARSIGREGLSKASNSAWHQLVTWERCDTCSSHSRVTAHEKPHEKRHSDPPDHVTPRKRNRGCNAPPMTTLKHLQPNANNRVHAACFQGKWQQFNKTENNNKNTPLNGEPSRAGTMFESPCPLPSGKSLR